MPVMHDTWIVKKNTSIQGETNQSATSDLVKGSHVKKEIYCDIYVQCGWLIK